ncbi:MAG: hypothetical protein ACI30Q_04990, partial [Muribaculaceae bacterium]
MRTIFSQNSPRRFSQAQHNRLGCRAKHHYNITTFSDCPGKPGLLALHHEKINRKKRFIHDIFGN